MPLQVVDCIEAEAGNLNITRRNRSKEVSAFRNYRRKPEVILMYQFCYGDLLQVRLKPVGIVKTIEGRNITVLLVIVDLYIEIKKLVKQYRKFAFIAAPYANSIVAGL